METGGIIRALGWTSCFVGLVSVGYLITADALKNLPRREKIFDPQERHNRWERRYWAATSVFTVGAVFAAIYGVVVAKDALKASRDQADIASGQLHVMRDEQRPWIKVTVEKVDRYWNRWRGGAGRIPTINYWGVFNIVFRLTNVGKSPAFNLQFRIEGYIDGMGKASLLDTQRSMCEGIRTVAPAPDVPVGIVLPDDHILTTDFEGENPFSVAGVKFSYPEFASEAARYRSARVLIYGCADYTFDPYGKSLHHQSGFVFQVEQVLVDHENKLAPQFDLTQFFAGNQMVLVPVWAGPVRTD